MTVLQSGGPVLPAGFSHPRVCFRHQDAVRVSWDSPCIAPTTHGPAIPAILRSCPWLLARVVEEHGAHLWPLSGAATGTSSWESTSSCSLPRPTPFLGCLGEGQVPVVGALLRSARGTAESVHPSVRLSITRALLARWGPRWAGGRVARGRKRGQKPGRGDNYRLSGG